MNARFDLRLSKPEFLRWIEAPERRAAKFEWSVGRVVRRAGATRVHALIASLPLAEVYRGLAIE